MGLETASYIDQLNASNPLAVDPKSQGDDHLRLIKTVLKTQFPYLGEAAVNTTATQINVLTEITASAAEINKLTGVTSTTAQLNLVNTVPVSRTSIYDAIYPIGCIYQSTVATSPTELFAGTTWTAFSEGRVLAGYNSADGDFAAGATAGSKTHSMTTAEMPAHTHNVTAMALTTGSLNTVGSGVKSSSQSLTTSSTGSGNAFNIMQPYQVVYMWTRTA
jgi:hypothetical protein